MDKIKKLIADLRDETPCDENSQGYGSSRNHCGCEKFDMIIDEVDKYRDLALTTTIVYSELEHKGSIFQMFDECYKIAQEFCQKFSHDINWEKQELDYDEAIAEFVREREERRLQNG